MQLQRLFNNLLLAKRTKVEPFYHHLVVWLLIGKASKGVKLEHFANKLVMHVVISSLLVFYATEGWRTHMGYKIPAQIYAYVMVGTSINIE
jgi:hypothetical protein